MKTSDIFTVSIYKKLAIIMTFIIFVFILLSIIEFIKYNKRITLKLSPVAQIITPEGSVIKEFNTYKQPLCINVSENKNLLICDNENKRFLITDSKGKEIWTYEAVEPHFIEETKDNTYILTDKHYAYEVNSNKEVLWKSKKFNYLYKVSKTVDGNYAILSAWTTMIQSFRIFTPGYYMLMLKMRLQNKNIKDLLSKNPSYQLPLPKSSQLVVVNKDNNIIVDISSRLHLISIPFFQILNNGNYFITDYENKRLIEIDSNLNIVYRPYLDSSYIYNALMLPDGDIAFIDIYRNYYHLIGPEEELLAEQKCFYADNMSLTPDNNIALIRFKEEKP